MGLGDKAILSEIKAKHQLAKSTEIPKLKDGQNLVMLARVEHHKIKQTRNDDNYGVFYFKDIRGDEISGVYFSDWGKELPQEVLNKNFKGQLKVIRGKYNLEYNNIQIDHIGG